MTVAACVNVIIPALTKPMIITVVAPELWIAAVVTAPIPTPIILFPDTFLNRARSLLELTASRLELIVEHATRNIPMPASIDNTAEIITVELIVVLSSDLLFYGRKKDFTTTDVAKSRFLQHVPGIPPVLTKACYMLRLHASYSL